MHRALKYFYHLRRALRSNLDIIEQYGDTLHTLPPSLIADPDPAIYTTLSDLEGAQNAFAMNHASIAQCLINMQGTWDLPGNDDFRLCRNVFCHTFLTPGRNETLMGWHFKGQSQVRDYTKLFELVVKNIGVLEEQLNDGHNWRRPWDEAVDDAAEIEEVAVAPWIGLWTTRKLSLNTTLALETKSMFKLNLLQSKSPASLLSL